MMKKNQNGYLITEMLVASFIGLIFMSAMLSTVVSNMNRINEDIGRTRVNQNIRGGFDILSTNIREMGENLISVFPVVELTNGTSGASDSLTIRRGLLAEIPSLCQSISGNNFYITNSTPTSGCSYAGNAANYNAWRNYRLNNGGVVKVFIYDRTTRNGEFINYSTETNTGTQYYLTKSSGSLTYSYTVGNTSLYLIEQVVVSRNSDRLQVSTNGDTINPSSLMFGLTDFQVTIGKRDGTTSSSFARTDDWSLISYLDLTLSATDKGGSKTFNRALTMRIFPRNILAN